MPETARSNQPGLHQQEKAQNRLNGELFTRQNTRYLSEACPEKFRSETFKWFMDNNMAYAVDRLAFVSDEKNPVILRRDPDFLERMIKRYPETRDKLIQQGIYTALMQPKWEQLPLDQYLDAMVEGGYGKGTVEERRQAAAAVACNSLANRLFRAGDSPIKPSEISTRDELLKHLGRNSVELLEKHPDAFWDAVFPSLAMLNTKSALQLVSDLPPDRKSQLLLKAGHSWQIGRMGNAAQLHAMFTAVPYDEAQGPLQDRFECWVGVSARAYSRYGDSYVDWLRTFPKGVERDMAMSALTHVVKPLDPELGAQLWVEKLQGKTDP